MNCQVCGAELLSGAQFCGSCGAPVTAPTASAAVPPQPPPTAPSGAVPPGTLPPYPGAGPAGEEPSGSKKGLLWGIVAAVVVVLLGVGGFVLLGGDDDDDETTSGPSTTKAPATTTTEAAALLGLAEWVEAADEICEDTNDEIAEMPGSTEEEAAEALPDLVTLFEDQLDDLEALGPPDDDPDVEVLVGLLGDQIVFISGLDDAIQDGDDPADVFDEARDAGDELVADLRDAADELDLEHCGQVVGEDPTPTTDDPDPPTTGDGEPYTYGDDPELDALWDACADGDAEACDDLWAQSPVDSEYEDFGYSCGGVVPEGEAEICSDVLGGDTPPPDDGEANSYGDDAALDALWDACSAGDGQACDDLFWDSPIDSEYETFGDTCGYRFPEDDTPITCVDAI